MVGTRRSSPRLQVKTEAASSDEKHAQPSPAKTTPTRRSRNTTPVKKVRYTMRMALRQMRLLGHECRADWAMALYVVPCERFEGQDPDTDQARSFPQCRQGA